MGLADRRFRPFKAGRHSELVQGSSLGALFAVHCIAPSSSLGVAADPNAETSSHDYLWIWNHDTSAPL